MGEVDIGAYSDAVFTTLRFTPADCPPSIVALKCPGGIWASGIGGYTFGDFGKVFAGAEVHSDGEIWVQTLWDLRAQLVLGTGSEQDGSDLAEALVTEAMRLSPPEPSFLDMRNSILVADQGITGGDLQDLIWSVFAGRGMGFYASVADSSDVTPIEDFNLPPAPDAPTATVEGTVTSADTGLPLEGITVGFGGHTTDPSFPSNLSDTDRRRRATTPSMAPVGNYGELVFKGAAGFDQISLEGIQLDGEETETHDVEMRRDWAAASSGGATVTSSDDSGSTLRLRRRPGDRPVPRHRLVALQPRQLRSREPARRPADGDDHASAAGRHSTRWAWIRATPAATGPRRRPRTTGC